MSLKDILTSGPSIVLILLCLVQIAPIKIDPFTAFAKWLGKMSNAELEKKLDDANASVLGKLEQSNLEMNERLDRRIADNSRYRILRFDDEVRHKKAHSEEHFNQILSDIKEYENYCDKHQDYKNDKARFAIENIRNDYRVRREENNFLV